MGEKKTKNDKAESAVKASDEINLKEEKKLEEQENPYWKLIKECRLLYRQAKLPMTQTCMCWGIECGKGWLEPIRNLSYRLECINYAICRKWGFVIEAEQVKEKYGTLRFYFSVRYVAPFLRRFFSAPFLWLGLVNPTATGVEKKVGDAIGSFFYRIGERIRYGSMRAQQKRHVIAQAIDRYVEDMVKEADCECFNVCEDCGANFAWRRRCETQGWITYVCPECAKARHSNYYYAFTDKERMELSRNEEGRKVLKLEGVLLDEDGKPLHDSVPKEASDKHKIGRKVKKTTEKPTPQNPAPKSSKKRNK